MAEGINVKGVQETNVILYYCGLRSLMQLHSLDTQTVGPKALNGIMVMNSEFGRN
jgi:hypothetical protein